MSEHLTETAAEVAALIPRFSWQLMDEEQRDDLMENVVLPRYMGTTSDGTNLGPTWWSEALGATPAAIRDRVYRLRSKKSSEQENARGRVVEPNSRTGRAAATLRDPEKAAEVLADPEVRNSVRKALDDRYEQAPKPIQPQPSQGNEPLELLTRFRRVHKDVDRIIELVLEGRAVVSDAERAALTEEARWLRAASEHIETGLNAGSLEQSLREFQEEYL